jgi:DNA-binding CsgD family transcriptional regulator
LMLIGRDAEAAKVTTFLGELAGGSRILLIEGEAGIGKTTLLREGHATARLTGMTVLSAFPVESEIPLEFAGLTDLLDKVPATAIDGLPLPQRQVLRQAVLRTVPQVSAADPRTVATAVLTLLRHLARNRQVLIVVDDLPWLDAASARTLSFALRRLKDEHVGLLAAVRTGWPTDPLPMATDCVPEVRVDRIRLGPLSLGATRELLATRTSLSPGRSLLLQIHDKSGGNPLFALELAARARTNSLPGLPDTVSMPDSLRRLVLGRVTVLPAQTRDVLLVSSLTTEPVLPVICAAACHPATAHTDLEVGIRAGLLAVTDGDVAFIHPLIRRVVAEDAGPADRRAAHRRLAAVVHGPEARARHLAFGAEGSDEAVASELEDAARTAARRGACDTAAELAELAVTLSPLTRREDRQRRIVLAAEQRFEASDPARACSLLESVIDSMPPGPPRAELWRRLARYRAIRGAPMALWTASLDAALQEAGEDAHVRAVIMMDQAVSMSNAGDLPEAIRIGEQVIELTGRTGDKALEAQGCAGLAFASFVLGRGLRPDLISRALAGPGQLSRLSIELRPKVAIGHILHWSDDLDGARLLYEQEYTRAVEEGVETGLPFVLWALAENEAWAGNWSRAEKLVAEGYRLAEDSGGPVPLAIMSAIRGLLYAYRGQIEAGVRDATHAMEVAGQVGMPLLSTIAAQVFGVAALSTGDALSTHAHLGSLADALSATGVTEPGVCHFLPDEIEALTRLGKLNEAEALLDPFEARSTQLDRVWGLAVAGRCRGLLLAAQGDVVHAQEALDTALTTHRLLPMPFEEARTLLAAGEVQRRARHKHNARVFLEAALAIFERLGAPRWQRRTADELARIGLSVSPPEAGQALTAAERRVADLVAAGHTNAEIATELFMGRRTVEAHLSRIYQKFSLRSRTELCRRLLERTPAPLP